MELTGFDADITGENVVKHDVFDKVASVVFFVIVLLRVADRDGQDIDILIGEIIGAVNKNRVFRTDRGAEAFENHVVNSYHIRAGENLFADRRIEHFADTTELTARDDRAGFVDHADHAVNGVFQLVNDALK